MPLPTSQLTSEKTLSGQIPKATSDSSTNIRTNWDEELKSQSIYSARTTSQRYVDAIKKQLADVAARKVTPQQAELSLKKTLETLGYNPQSGFGDGRVPPAKPGEIRDLSSTRRIQLIIDTNIKQAISLGQMAASENPMQLMMTPAWELRRMGARKKPRGDWKKRWSAAGNRCGWKGALKKRMIALKTSPIWQALADGAGGFNDTLGSPYPPFAFGSGLAWAGVGRKEWMKHCAAEGVSDGLDEITARAKELKAKGGEIKGISKFEGVDKSFERTQQVAPAKVAEPISGLFKPNLKSRLEANDVIDECLDEINAMRRAISAITDEMAKLREEAGKIAGPKPIGERRKLQDLITTKRSAVRDASIEVDALWGRVVGYGQSVETMPIPTNESAQKSFNEAMARYSKAAEKTVREVKKQVGRIELFVAAARKYMEKLRELKVEFVADEKSRKEVLKSITDGEMEIAKKQSLPQQWMQDIVACETELATKKLDWPNADYSKCGVLLVDARVKISQMVADFTNAKDSLRLIKTATEGAPTPINELMQSQFDSAMATRKHDVQSVLQSLDAKINAFNISDVVKAVETERNEAVKNEKIRICADILVKADARKQDVVGNQVTEILAEKKTIDKEANGKGVIIDKNNPIAKSWERTYNAVRSARTNVRKLFSELERLCNEVKVEEAQQAEIKFGLGADFCMKKYGALENLLEDWKDELKRIETALRTQATSQPSPSQGGSQNGSQKGLSHDSAAFPQELSAEDIAQAKGGIGGSTGAKLYTDGLGRKFVLKQTNSTTQGDGKITREHLENEAATDGIYRAAGIKVPDFKVFEVEGKSVKLASFIPNAKPLGDWMASASSQQKQELRKKLAKGFLLDAVLANWDVAGASLDNILVDSSGEPWRIDNGSGMGYRARGVKKKPDEWENSKFPDEWRTLRSQNSTVFGGLSAHDIFSQEIDWDAVIKATPVKDRPIVERRAKEMKEMQKRCKNFDKGKFAPEATSDILEKSYDACKDGLRETIPTEKIEYNKYGNFRPKANLGSAHWNEYQYSNIIIAAAKSINHHLNGDKKPNMQKVQDALAIKSKLQALAKKDSNAKTLLKALKEIEDSAASSFSMAIGQVPKLSLQKPKGAQVNTTPSVTEAVIDFVEKTTGNYAFIKSWCNSQASSSWDYDACKAKILEFELRGKNPDPTTGKKLPNGRIVGKNGELYGWGSRAKVYKAAWEDYQNNPDQLKKDRDAFRAYKACCQIALENLDCANNDKESGTLILCRTERSDVMTMDGMKVGQFGRMMRSGAESHSIFKTVTIAGANQLTIVRVPYSRVSAMYFMDRDKNGGSLFLGDSENEFNVDINNGELPVYYYGKVYANRDTTPYIKKFLAAEKAAGLGG